MDSAHHLKGLSLVISGGIFWGSSGTLAQYMFHTQDVSPLWVTGIRLLSAGILLLLSYIFITHKSIFSVWSKRKNIIRLLCFGLLGMLPSQLFYFLAIRYSNAATATILQFTSPIFIMGYLACLNHHLNLHDLISVIAVVFGTVLLVTRGHITSLSISTLGLIFGLGAGLAGASYTLTPIKLLKHYDPKLICGWAMTLGSIPLLLSMPTLSQPTIDTTLIGELIFIIIFGTTIAYLFYVSSLEYLRPTITGILSSFEPLTATVLSIFLLGMDFNWAEILGGIIVLTTVICQSILMKN